MKCFDIFDTENGFSVGTLLYYEWEKVFIIELVSGLDEWTAPLLFTAYVKRGILTIQRDMSLAWVRERVIPSNRQNINMILKTHRLKEYDEIKILEISEGKCSQDSLIVKKIVDIPKYVKKRMERNLTDVLVSDDSLILFFMDNSVRKISFDKLYNISEAEKLKDNRMLLESGRVGAGGYYATFNNSIDIPAAKLYQTGVKLPLRRGDFVNFVKKNMMDTSEACRILECTRQNLSYMVNKGSLKPVKEDVKGNLYQKGNLYNLDE